MASRYDPLSPLVVSCPYLEKAKVSHLKSDADNPEYMVPRGTMRMRVASVLPWAHNASLEILLER